MLKEEAIETRTKRRRRGRSFIDYQKRKERKEYDRRRITTDAVS